MKKRIYLEHAWHPRLSEVNLVKYPPEGYEFITKRGGHLTRYTRNAIAYRTYNWLSQLCPLNLVRSWIDGLQRSPKDVVLTYAIMHLVFRKEPWLLELPIDEPIRLIGLERHFSAHKKVMERLLESSYCRKIICRALAVKECLLSRVKGSDISNKIVVIYGATPPKRISLEKPERDKVKLLFIGSANILAEWDFAIKGGPILLEAFRVLTQRYDNIELVVRSRVPQVFKERYSRLPRIRFFEHILSEERLKHEWMTADIFVMPSHVTPDAVFIEAMSYGLPVVTTDVWANPEIVEDGRTGFLIPNPGMAKFTEGYILHLDSPKFKQYINSIDYGMVESLVSKLTILIENGELRYRLSKAARWEVEHGKFSLKKRNEKLKKVLDEITNCADTF